MDGTKTKPVLPTRYSGCLFPDMERRIPRRRQSRSFWTIREQSTPAITGMRSNRDPRHIICRYFDGFIVLNWFLWIDCSESQARHTCTCFNELSLLNFLDDSRALYARNNGDAIQPRSQALPANQLYYTNIFMNWLFRMFQTIWEYSTPATRGTRPTAIPGTSRQPIVSHKYFHGLIDQKLLDASKAV